MSSPCRGRAFVINNMIFSEPQHSPRDGSQIDVENLTSLLQKLSIEQTVAEDFTAEVRDLGLLVRLCNGVLVAIE